MDLLTRVESGERSSLLAAPRAPPRSALSRALRFARVARARLARGDAYALGNAAFVLGSAAYCALDLLPPVGPFLDDALLVGLAALFVADALLYLRAWGGPLVGRGPCLGGSCGSGSSGGGGGKAEAGDAEVDDGPTHLDLAAEWINVSAATIYLAATVAGLLTPSTDVAVPQLALIYSLQGLSSLLFLVDALLYAASWHASAAAAADASTGGGASGKGEGGGGGGGGGGSDAGIGGACSLLLDPFLLAHILNVLPATAYAVCGVASLALFVHEAAGGRAADRYEDNRNVRGRLIAGAEPPEIELTCIAADFFYLACSLFTVAAWWTEADAEESEEEESGKSRDGR
jgi:hypothetical protein